MDVALQKGCNAFGLIIATLHRSFECGLRSAYGALDWWRNHRICVGAGQTTHLLRWALCLSCSKGFAAQATYSIAYDMHMAVLPKICEKLHHPLEEEHPEERANDATSALLLCGVAVDRQARVQIGFEAKEAYGASPWNEDKDVGDVVRLLQSRRAIVSRPRVQRDGCGSSTTIHLPSRLSCSAQVKLERAPHGRPCTSLPRSSCRMPSGARPQRSASACRQMLDRAPRAPRKGHEHVRTVICEGSVPPLLQVRRSGS